MANDAVWTLRDTSHQMSVPGKILISILQGTVLNREILPKKNRHQLSKKKHPPNLIGRFREDFEGEK